MLHIGFFIHNLSFHGGTERISIALANALSRFPDYRISMISMEPFASAFFPLDDKIETGSLHVVNADIRKSYFKAVKRLRKYLKENDIDILVDVDVILSAISLAATTFTRTKVISWEHYNYFTKTESPVRRIARKLAARYSKAIVTLTDQDVGFYRENCKVKAKMLSISNFVEEFPDASYDNSQKTILSIGHLEHRKGFDLLLAIWEKIDPKIKAGWQLLIIGEGEEKTSLEEQIKEHLANDAVRILSPTNHIAAYYQKASLYAMTSRAEGLPMVLIEAKSYGIPIIAFDCKTGPGEIINDGKDGFLISCFDTELYAEKLSQLMLDADLQKQMSVYALNDRYRFAQEVATQKWVGLLNLL